MLRGKRVKLSRAISTVGRAGVMTQARLAAAVMSAAAVIPAEGAMVSTRRSCAPRREKSRSIASPSRRRSPLSRCMATAMANRIAMQVRKMIQPSKKCRNPSAWPMP